MQQQIVHMNKKKHSVITWAIKSQFVSSVSFAEFEIFFHLTMMVFFAFFLLKLSYFSTTLVSLCCSCCHINWIRKIERGSQYMYVHFVKMSSAFFSFQFFFHSLGCTSRIYSLHALCRGLFFLLMKIKKDNFIW